MAVSSKEYWEFNSVRRCGRRRQLGLFPSSCSARHSSRLPGSSNGEERLGLLAGQSLEVYEVERRERFFRGSPCPPRVFPVGLDGSPESEEASGLVSINCLSVNSIRLQRQIRVRYGVQLLRSELREQATYEARHGVTLLENELRLGDISEPSANSGCLLKRSGFSGTAGPVQSPPGGSL